jgi:S1-C subfamily serine protease
VALLRIPTGNLTELPFGDSDRLKVGDLVVAVGNPFGLGQTVTSGIVSALGRSGLGIEGYEDFIQTDASINPGNSGGALVDLRGRLIGINTAILAPGGGNIGIGFAVPINMARRVMEQLVRYGEVKRGRIGIAIQELTPELATAMGTQRTEGAVNGAAVRSATQLRNSIGLGRVGDVVAMTIERKGEVRNVETRIDQTAEEQTKRSGRQPRRGTP